MSRLNFCSFLVIAFNIASDYSDNITLQKLNVVIYVPNLLLLSVVLL